PVGLPVSGVALVVGAKGLAVDSVELDEAPLGGRLVGGVEEVPPDGAAPQAPPGEIGRGVPDGEAGGGRRGGQGGGLVELQGPGGGDVVHAHQGQEDAGAQQTTVAGAGRAGAAGGGGHEVTDGGDP